VGELERVFEAALEAIRGGEPAALVTVVEARGATPREAGAKMLVYTDGRTEGTVGGGQVEARAIKEALVALTEGAPREVTVHPTRETPDTEEACGSGMRLLVEVLQPRPTLLVIGAGHIGQALVELGAFIGYRIAVLDERAEMVTAERFPRADVLLSGPLDEQLAQFPLTPQTCVAFVTPHSSRDEKGLAALVGRPPAYVGLLGSRRRTAATFERARSLGIPKEFLARVHTPIGLAIGAETPREIALCIIAEIVALQRAEPSGSPQRQTEGRA
jgi:xanthine dehydrogenase accessory factor